ncbi:MAG: PorT family protein [Bacteroidetes bacterium]|nr:PorT family protein [Bacteroidota bacterium]
MAQRPNLQLRAFAGMNVITVTSKSEPSLDGVSTGYLAGFGVRITKKKLYGQLDFNFIRSGISVDLRRIGGTLPKSSVRISAFEAPLVVGYKFANTAFFKWHLFTGINTLIVTRVKENDIGLQRDDLHNAQFGLRAGSGIDFAFFTFDFHYTYGLNKLIKDSGRTNSHLLEFNIGVIF